MTLDAGDRALLLQVAELEYLLVHRALRGQGFVYECLYDGDALPSV